MTTGAFDNSNPLNPPFAGSLGVISVSVRFLDPAEHLKSGVNSRVEWQDCAFVEGRAVKGACWALAIEGAGAICIYGLWHLWTLLH
jgi:hypothetical protein